VTKATASKHAIRDQDLFRLPPSMAGGFFSLFDLLFLFICWGAWLQYKTSAGQGDQIILKNVYR